MKGIFVLFPLFFIVFTTNLHAERFRSVRIQSATVYDTGSFSDAGNSNAVDLVQNDCADSGDDPDLEPFFDSFIGLQVANQLNRELRVIRSRVRMRVPSYGKVRSRRLAPVAGALIPAREEGEVVIPFLDVTNGGKRIPQRGFTLEPDLGFRVVRVLLVGRTSFGERVRFRTRITVSLDDIDRCSSS